jgi:hypothetical protein
MKQYAVSGNVDSSGSTSDMRKSWKPRCARRHGNNAEGEEDTGLGRVASDTLSAGAGDNKPPEDMLGRSFVEIGMYAPEMERAER